MYKTRKSILKTTNKSSRKSRQKTRRKGSRKGSRKRMPRSGRKGSSKRSRKTSSKRSRKTSSKRMPRSGRKGSRKQIPRSARKGSSKRMPRSGRKGRRKGRRKTNRKLHMYGEGSESDLSKIFGSEQFTLKSKFYLPDSSINGVEFGQNAVKIQINELTDKFLYFYTSQTSGGFWRIYLPNFNKLDRNTCKDKYGHYLTTTFVNLDLQSWINQHFDSIPYEPNLPNKHEDNFKTALRKTKNALAYIQETSFPEKDLKSVLCDAVTDFPSLNGLSKSLYLLSSRHFQDIAFTNQNSDYLKSIKSSKYYPNFVDMHKNVRNQWINPEKELKGKWDSKLLGINERHKDDELLEPERRISSMNIMINYIDSIIKENFDIVGSGIIPFTFLKYNYNIASSPNNILYYQDFQSKEYPEEVFRLYTAVYDNIGPVNILLIPLIHGSPPEINIFGGYVLSVDPGLWVYKIADYLKQYPLKIEPITPGANIGLTNYPRLPLN